MEREQVGRVNEVNAAMESLRSTRPKRILCATDFSANASRAFQTAIWMARSCGAALRVVHVSPFDLTSRVSASETQGGRDERLERFVRSEEVADLTISHEVRQGDPAVEIVRASVDDAADLILIGRHSQVASGGWSLGSVPQAVVRTAPCPVLVAAPGAPFGAIRVRHVLCALDLAETSSDTLAYAAGIARAIRADLQLLHVVSATEATEAERADPATALSCLATTVPASAGAGSRIVVGDDIHQAIAEQVRENDTDLLVVGQHGGNMSPRHYIGGTTLSLLRRAECAVLVVPPRLAGETTAVGSVQS